MSPEIKLIFFYPQFNLIVGYRIHNLKNIFLDLKKAVLKNWFLRPPTFEFAVNINQLRNFSVQSSSDGYSFSVHG